MSNETNQDMLATRGPGGGGIIQLIVSGKKSILRLQEILKHFLQFTAEMISNMQSKVSGKKHMKFTRNLFYTVYR